jgi:hypothetical protein
MAASATATCCASSSRAWCGGEWLTADTAYGSAEMLEWLVHDQAIAPHIPVFDKSKRDDGTFSRADFTYDGQADLYRCPGGHELKRYRRAFSSPRTGPPADVTPTVVA